MRIATQSVFQQGLSSIQRLQAAIDYAQRQISSGRRILTPSDDPVAASQAVGVRESLARLDQFERNITVARNRLGREETALTATTDILQRVRELALQANNATQTNESRGLIAIELRQQLDSLVQIANQQDSAGRFVFSGNMVENKPVSQNGSAYSYNGDQGQRLIQVGESRQITDGDSGAAVFFEIRDGNGVFSVSAADGNTGTGVLGAGTVQDAALYDRDDYTVRFLDPANYEVLDSGGATIGSGTFQNGDTLSFQGVGITITGTPEANDEFLVAASRNRDAFTIVADLADAIDRTAYDDVSRARLSNGINNGLSDIDQALGNILDVRTRIGSRLAALDSQEDTNSRFELTLQETLADIEDLDYAEAISRLTSQVQTLEAAQQTFVRTQSLSLFNYF